VPFWRGSIAAVGGPSVNGLAFLLALAAMMIAIHALLLLLIPRAQDPRGARRRAALLRIGSFSTTKSPSTSISTR
jgi:hypothetical protein